MTDSTWLPTAEAAKHLGLSTWTLKRCRDIDGGFLVEGTDWTFGATANSPLRWHISNAEKRFADRGAQLRQEAAV